MSAFLCNKNHYQFVADGLYKLDNEVNGAGDKENIVKEVNEFIGLNIFALTERYGDIKGFGDKPVIAFVDGDRFSRLTIVELVQLIKALRCIAYQCSEGKAFGSDTMVYIKDRIIEALNLYIKRTDGEYAQLEESSQWEIV